MSELANDSTLAATLACGDAPPQAAPSTEVPSIRGQSLGRYLLLSQIGAGGMGIVYAAYDPDLDRRVALKLLKHPAGGLDAPRKRLQREAQALARLDHPNVVAVYDVGVHADHLFIAMEFVAGTTLGSWMREADAPPTLSGRFGAGAAPRVRPWREVLAVFTQAGRGLAAAHSVGLVHRDVKPDNVMLSADGRVRVMDFGLARADADEVFARVDVNAPLVELTQAGTIVGTPAYMSLEQFETKDVDARSDQFSFCVALYEALYGERPFVGDTLAELVAALQAGVVQSAPRGAVVPAWVRAVVLRGLARDPGARFASMQALLDALAADPLARRRRIVIRIGLALTLVLGGWFLVALSLRLGQRDARIAEQAVEIGQKDVELANRLATQTKLLSVQRGLRATMLIPEAREADALLLAIQAVGQYAEHWHRAPREALEGLEQVLARDTVIITDERVLRGHRDYLTDVEYSPDGTRLATASFDGTARVWDPVSGALIATLAGHDGRVLDVSFAPDGARLATVGEDGMVQLWPVDTGEALARFSGHSEPVVQAVFSPDGARLATAGFDGAVKIWDAVSGAHRFTLRDPAEQPFHVLAFAPDGSRLAAAGASATVWTWDPVSGSLRTTSAGHTGAVFTLAFSPDGTRLASGGEERSVRVWNADDGRPVVTLEGHGGRVTSLGFAPDRPQLATVGWDTVGRVFDVETGALLHELRGGHGAGIIGLAYRHDGAHLATASYEGSVTTWSPATGAILERLVGHPNDVWSLDFSPDGRRLATGGVDGTARIWDLGYTRVAMQAGPERDVRAFAFLPDHTRITTLDTSGRARVWDVSSGTVLATLGDGETLAIAASSDGRHVATLDRSMARVWDVSTGEAAATLLAPATADALFYSPDGVRLYARSPKEIWILDTVTSERTGTIELTGGYHNHAFSPDGSRLALALDGPSAAVWDAHRGRRVAELVHAGGRTDQLAWSPDGAHIALARQDEVSLWESDSYTRLAVCEGHRGLSTGLAFSPDNSRLLATSANYGARVWDSPACQLLAGYDPDEQNPKTGRGHFTRDGREVVFPSARIVRVWNLETSQIRIDLDGHDAGVEEVVHSSDGAHLITLSGGTLRTWELATGELVSRDRIGVVGPDGQVVWPTHPRDLMRLACGRLRMHGPIEDQVHDICAPLIDSTAG